MNPLMWIAVGTTILGALTSYQGNKMNAAAAQDAANTRMQAAQYEASQAEQQAGQAVAAGSENAQIEQRNAQLVKSRQLALAGASGAGASDPTMVSLISRTAGEGSYRAALALYHGEETSRNLKQQAASDLYEGQIAAHNFEQKADSDDMAANASLIKGAGGALSLYGKYGAGGPSGDSKLIGTTNYSNRG